MIGWVMTRRRNQAWKIQRAVLGNLTARVAELEFKFDHMQKLIQLSIGLELSPLITFSVFDI